MATAQAPEQAPSSLLQAGGVSVGKVQRQQPVVADAQSLSGCVCAALVCGLRGGAGCRPEVPLQIPISTAYVPPHGLGGSCRSIWQEQGKFLCRFCKLLSHPSLLCVVPCLPLRTGDCCSWPSLTAVSALPASHVPGTPENSL